MKIKATLIALVPVCVVLSLWLLFDRGEPPSAAFHETEAWVGALARGEKVEFLDERTRQPLIVTQRSETSPTLTHDQRFEFESYIRKTIVSQRVALQKAREELDGFELLHEEAELMRSLTRRETCLRAVENGDYVMVDYGDPGPWVERELSEFGVDATPAMSFPQGDPRVTLWLLMPYSKYPELLEAEKNRNEMGFLRSEDEVLRFNSRPYAERRDLFDAHCAWKEKIASSPKLTSDMSNEERETVKAEMFRIRAEAGVDPLPYHSKRDDVRCLLTVIRH